MGCIRWHAWKVWSYKETIEYEDDRGKFQISSQVRDIDGTFVFYVRTTTCKPIFKGEIARVEYLGEV